MDVIKAPEKPPCKPGERWWRVEATTEHPAYWRNDFCLETTFVPEWSSMPLESVFALAESLELEHIMTASSRGTFQRYDRHDGTWHGELVRLVDDDVDRHVWPNFNETGRPAYQGKQKRRTG